MAKQLWTPDHTYMNLLDPIPKPWGLLWNWSSFLSGLSTRSGNLQLFSFKGIVVALEHLQQHIQVLRYILFALTVRKSFWGLSPFFLVQAVVLKMQRLESIYTRSCVEQRFNSLSTATPFSWKGRVHTYCRQDALRSSFGLGGHYCPPNVTHLSELGHIATTP